MFPLLATLILAAQPPAPSAASPAGTARIFSTVGHSEWCPAGNATVDLGTGRYSLTPRAPRPRCNDAGLDRPRLEGVLSGGTLAAVRAAYGRVLTEGLRKPVCRGPDGEVVIVSNGGTPILVLTTGALTASAPENLACWTDAADKLHQALEEAFSSYHHP